MHMIFPAPGVILLRALDIFRPTLYTQSDGALKRQTVRHAFCALHDCSASLAAARVGTI